MYEEMTLALPYRGRSGRSTMLRLIIRAYKIQTADSKISVTAFPSLVLTTQDIPDVRDMEQPLHTLLVPFRLIKSLEPDKCD